MTAADKAPHVQDQPGQMAEVDVVVELGHGALLGGDEDVAAEQISRPYLTSTAHQEADAQVWEHRIPGTDLTRTRIHLEVDEGRVSPHEAVVAQLLVDPGWERAS